MNKSKMGIFQDFQEAVWNSDPKWDNDYPGPFTALSDNDDQIAHLCADTIVSENYITEKIEELYPDW
tara:strand:- start:716 stop:916 length:201 start_codon:yes stop_codon:yes gene_type:complete